VRAKRGAYDVEALSLLAFARAQQREYISAGAAFQLGLDAANRRVTRRRWRTCSETGLAVKRAAVQRGIGALNRAGGVEVENDRSSGDEGTPQGKIEKQYGPPREYLAIQGGGACARVLVLP